MANMSPVDFIKTVPPGISWTDEPRSTPWSTPPKYVKVSDVASVYIGTLSQPSVINRAVDLIETKIPIAAIANALMLTGVAEGTHTIDTGILVTPVIIEMLVTLAEIHGVDYEVFDKEPSDDIVPDRIIKNALKKASVVTTDNVEDEPVVELSGLMARKPKKMESM
jgi:hypothetical protein